MFDVELQERDFELLKGLLESRVMSLSHATALFFDGKAEAAKKRVQKLKASGHIGERRKLPGDPSILFLTRKAFLALRDHGQLPEARQRLTWEFLEKRPRVSELTLRHELEVMDVKTALCVAAAKTQHLSIREFATWPMFFQFQATVPSTEMLRRDMLVKPDGFIRIHEMTGGDQFEITFFLEADRSTEVLDTLVQKAHGYLDFYKSGGFAKRMGHPREDYRLFPFRVLMVVRNEERRNNIAERLLLSDPPILSLVWLATMPEMLADPMGRIWMRPKDYQEATEGTAFDPRKREPGPGYRRQAEREEHVARSVTRCSLLDP